MKNTAECREHSIGMVCINNLHQPCTKHCHNDFSILCRLLAIVWSNNIMIIGVLVLADSKLLVCICCHGLNGSSSNFDVNLCLPITKIMDHILRRFGSVFWWEVYIILEDTSQSRSVPENHATSASKMARW